MRRLLPMFSLLLLALWLPATQHCVLDAAGVITKACADDASVGDDHAKDACTTVELSAYRASPHTLQAPPPDFTVCVGQLCVQSESASAPPPAVILPPGSLDRPRDWVSTWQFVRRAAPLSRAPSLTLA